MKLWLDDVRPPWRHGCLGWEWAKTYEQAIALLSTGRVTEASLDHDLSEAATMGYVGFCRDCGHPLKEELLTECPRCRSGRLTEEWTGYDVVCWLEDHPDYWPADGVRVHSMNPAGKARMEAVIRRAYEQREERKP